MKSVEDRFWEKVRKSEGCWMWGGRLSRANRGRFYFEGKDWFAHRVSWMITNHEDIPDGMCVCHHCDNPACVRPDHLFIGTQKDNMRDMWKKKRHPIPTRTPHPKGEECSWSKLKRHDVLNIIDLCRGGLSRRKVASKFGVDYGLINQIMSGRSWASVTGFRRKANA